ncbi:MAG: hypothetical protein ACMUIG_09650 [Thermoplasmatota archaeon]
MIEGTAPASRQRKMLVAGIGRGSSRIINLLHENQSDLVDTLYISTDEKAVNYTRAGTKILIGRRLCGGFGAEGLTDLGERAADDAKRDIEPYLQGYKMILIVSTLGKGTGSGATPVISSLAESSGAFVMNFLILPSATLESLHRTVGNHTRHQMIKRGFNVVTIDQDRFREINGEQAFSMTLANLDALLSGVIMSLVDVIFGRAERGITISDLKSLFKEGKEGSLHIGGGNLRFPRDAACEFISCGLLRSDPRTGKGILLNLVTPAEARRESTKPLIDEIFTQLGGGNRSVFIGTLRERDRRENVDLIGIITGMDDGSVDIASLCKNESGSRPKAPSARIQQDRWDIPMIR